MKYIKLTFSFLLFTAQISFSQEIIYLKNPSLEALPNYGSVPGGWKNCAFNFETPPDVHPLKNGQFQVNQIPQNGESYVGLVSRDNGTTESIGQELFTPLQAGQCYEISLYLCRSEKLMAVHRLTRKRMNFNQPLVLKIWGGISPCGKKSLLAESPLIEHLDWKKYEFNFSPNENFTYLKFEAYYLNEKSAAYNGNILLDNISHIFPINCHTGEYLIDKNNLKEPVYKYVKYSVPPKIQSEVYSYSENEPYMFRDLRMVEKMDGLIKLMGENCSGINFKNNSHFLKNNSGEYLLEIAANIRKFKNQQLLIGIVNDHQKLFKKRIKVIEKLFKEFGIPANQYKIISTKNNNSWTCVNKNIYLEIRKNKFEN